jgi:tetratricopeptide (TPR) repeat protein
MRASAEFFRRALALDSMYARAYVGLADAYVLSVEYGGASEEEFPRAEARRLAERTLELDPDLGDAYASLGILGWAQGDWRDADANLRAAIALDPSHADPYLWRSYVVQHGRGDLAQALQLAARAYELEPLMVRPGSIYAVLLSYTDSAARAVEVAEASVRVNPATTISISWWSLAMADVVSGDPSRAVEALERSLAINDQNYLGIASTFAAAGAHQRARELLARGQAEGASNWEVGMILAALGDIDQAFQTFDRASQPNWRRDWFRRGFLEFSPEYAQLRADPRFPALLARLKKELDLE